MQYMGMGSLQDIVTRGGCTNEMILARMSFCILKALSHIHANRMVHRDIKPHNLLMNSFGEVKISDFGLATTLNDTEDMAKTFVGTLIYMAPERIGGGDYSYPADVWSFGLSLVSVATGKYPLPTKDGFFGLVDSVANQHEDLMLPAHTFSELCRDFVARCVDIDPDTRATADELLQHPFIVEHRNDNYMAEWGGFAESLHLLEDSKHEITQLADAAYGHMYKHVLDFKAQTQSEFGHGLISRFGPKRVNATSIRPIEKSLQMGLAKAMDVPMELVYREFEKKRLYYNAKLLETNCCFSPQSWTASPGHARRHQLLGSDESDGGDPESKSSSLSRSMWHRFRDKFRRKPRVKTIGRQL